MTEMAETAELASIGPAIALYSRDMRAEFLTLREAAECLGVAPKTLARWVACGAVPAYRLPSGRLRFCREDLDLAFQPARRDDAIEPGTASVS